MIERRVVKRYASALYGEAERCGVVDLVESDLGLITHSLETMSALNDAFMSPLIPAGTKREIATQIFANKINEVTMHYLYLLIDKRREEVVTYTQEEFIRLANEARGITVAYVKTALDLTAHETASLKAALSAMTGKQVELEVELDPSLLGGLTVRIGDTVWDGSVTGYLGGLREQLLAGQTPHGTE